MAISITWSGAKQIFKEIKHPITTVRAVESVPRMLLVLYVKLENHLYFDPYEKKLFAINYGRVTHVGVSELSHHWFT